MPDQEPMIIELINIPFNKEATVKILIQMRKEKDPETLLAMLVFSLCQKNDEAFELFSQNPYLDEDILSLFIGLTFNEIYNSASKNIRRLISVGL